MPTITITYVDGDGVEHVNAPLTLAPSHVLAERWRDVSETFLPDATTEGREDDALAYAREVLALSEELRDRDCQFSLRQCAWMVYEPMAQEWIPLA